MPNKELEHLKLFENQFYRIFDNIEEYDYSNLEKKPIYRVGLKRINYAYRIILRSNPRPPVAKMFFPDIFVTWDAAGHGFENFIMSGRLFYGESPIWG